MQLSAQEFARKQKEYLYFNQRVVKAGRRKEYKQLYKENLKKIEEYMLTGRECSRSGRLERRLSGSQG